MASKGDVTPPLATEPWGKTMKRSTLFKLTAPLAVAALALSACGGDKPAGIGAASAGSSSAEQPSVSAPAPMPSAPSSPSMPSMPSTPDSTGGASMPSSAAPGGSATENDAAADQATRAFGQANPGYRVVSASLMATQQRNSLKQQEGITHSPAACRDLALDRKMSPDNGFSMGMATKTSTGTEGVGLFQVSDPALLTDLKATSDKAIAECATMEITGGGQKITTQNTRFDISVPGADAAWGNKSNVTTQSGQSTTVHAGFAFKGNRGVNIAISGNAATPTQVQDLAVKAMQAWDAEGATP